MVLTDGADFAGYTIVGMLRSAATGDVYLARRPDRPGSQVLLRVLPASLCSDDDFRERFFRERPAVIALDHPNIAQVTDRGESDGHLWQATEHVEGRDTAELMASRFPAVLPADEVLAIISAAAAGLDFAHEHKLVHRDVRPANIVQATSGDGGPRLLLTDFGLARPPGESGYTAPEELQGAAVDGRADQYALAATAIHLFTGAPLAGDAASGRLRVGELRPDLAGLDEVLARALAGNPEARFDSCGEFAAALAEHASGAGGDGGGGGGPQADGASGASVDPAYAVDYPAYDWTLRAPTAQQPAGVPEPEGAGRKGIIRWPGGGRPRTRLRPSVVGAAAALLLAALFVAGLTIGREMPESSSRARGSAKPTTSAPGATPTTPTVAGRMAPYPLDGLYRIEMQRSQETFNEAPTPEPPDVITWWGIRSACTATRCLAAAVLLGGPDHTQVISPGLRPLILEFSQGRWQSRPQTTQLPCVAYGGVRRVQTAQEELWLRPQSEFELAGEMMVAVKTDECDQGGGIIRIPAAATRDSDLPDAVEIPDPTQIAVPAPATPITPETSETPETQAPPSTGGSRPGG